MKNKDSISRNKSKVARTIADHRPPDTHIERMKAKEVSVPELHLKVNFWKDKPLGRTLSLRNKTGKTIAGAVLAVVGGYTGIELTPILNTGTDMELITEFLSGFEWQEVLTMAVLFLITMLITWAVTMQYISATLGERLKEIVAFYKQAVSEESEGGTQISEAERKQMLSKFINAIEQLLVDWFGIRIDLNKDGK